MTSLHVLYHHWYDVVLTSCVCPAVRQGSSEIYQLKFETFELLVGGKLTHSELRVQLE